VTAEVQETRDISVRFPGVQQAGAMQPDCHTGTHYKAVADENGFRAAHSLEYGAGHGDGFADEEQD
jgi:hypothetical protein